MTDIVCSTTKIIENKDKTLSLWNYNSKNYYIDAKNRLYDYNTIENIGIKNDNMLWKFLEYL